MVDIQKSTYNLLIPIGAYTDKEALLIADTISGLLRCRGIETSEKYIITNSDNKIVNHGFEERGSNEKR